MKKMIMAFVLLLVISPSFAQRKDPNKRQQKVKAAFTRHNTSMDTHRKGPNGEVMYNAPNGGKYYMKNGKRIYVHYKGNQ